MREEAMTTFVNDLFTVTYPAAWVAAEHEDSSGLILATSQSGMRRYRQGEAPAAGDQVLCISLTPAELFQALLIPIEPAPSATELAEAILAKLGALSGTEAGTVEIDVLEDGRDMTVRSARSDHAAGAVILLAPAEGVIAVSAVTCAPGDYEAAIATARSILSSLTVAGTVATLAAAIDPVMPVEAATM